MTHLLLAAIYLAFVGLGLPDGLLGAAWPAMRADASFRGFGGGMPPLSHSGFVFAIIAICTVVSALQSDRTTKRFGASRVTAFSTALAAVSLFGFSQCRSMAGLCLWAVPYGLAAGAIDAALNNYVALHFASRHMSWLHCMWGVGATAGPYVMGAALSRGAPWQRGYWLVGCAQVFVALAVLASLPLWKKAERAGPAAPGGGGGAADAAARRPLRLGEILRIPGAREILLCFFCYCAIEQTAGLWAATFLAHRGVDPERAAFFAGMFYLGITLGRAAGGFATFKWNDDQMLRIGEGIVLSGLVLVGAAALFPALPAGVACAGFVVAGFGCAPVYPSIIHSTPAHFGADKSQAIIGVQMAFAYLGTTCMPPLFGFLARRLAPTLLPLYLFALLALMALLYERVVRRTSAPARGASRLADRFRRYVADPRGLARAWRGLRDRRTVARSPFFDRAWYLREHPDVAVSGADPALHYLLAGAPAGLDPGPGFCGAEYLSLHPEARASGLDPLVHYERVGRRRGFRVSSLQPVGPADPAWRFPTPEEHQAAFPAKVAAVRAKAARGEKVRAVFFVADAAMFPARPLLDAMRRDPRFDARLAVIPDLRGIGADPGPAMERCRAALAQAYPPEAFLPVARGADGAWPDVLADFGADIVCHPSPYELSDFKYNPRRCVGRPFLPVYLSYSFSTSLFGYGVLGLQNYAYFWKVFTECAETAAEHAAHSLLGGGNGELVGYFKMDPLATAEPWPRNGNRKRVLLAPHHSVGGGANDVLALSNFDRYADYFLALPETHPELDFVFRPHPFLFPVLARPSKWGPDKVDGWIARMKAHPNVRWSDEGDYFPAFVSCDAIVQDCGSYLAEWLYTGKPCCFMLKSPSDVAAKFTPLGREILSHCYPAFCETDIETFLRDVVEAGEDPKAAARDRFRKTVMVNHPHAAGAALAAIRFDLGLA